MLKKHIYPKQLITKPSIILFCNSNFCFSTCFPITTLEVESQLIYTTCHLQARFFFQQLISGVSYCHSMVLLMFTVSHHINASPSV